MLSVNGRMRRPRPAARTMALVGITGMSGISLTIKGAPRIISRIISRRFAGYSDRQAIVTGHDGRTTAPAPRTSDLGVGALGLLFLLVGLLEEIDTDLVAIDPGQFAAAIGKSGRRQQQEEFLQMQTLDGTIDRQLGAGLGDVLHHTVAPPGAIDAHHVRGKTALKCDAIALAPFRCR